ncbi:MAG: winged helix-turn-helix domain-containing protein [Dehalococcoidales bacterium]|nr:winged helix-turn-helix domain-containing protein [Dehalococcoidales bacterium]
MSEHNGPNGVMRQRILEIVNRSGKISTKAVARICGLRPRGVWYHLDELRNDGLVSCTGRGSAALWEAITEEVVDASPGAELRDRTMGRFFQKLKTGVSHG